jgi:DNA-binding transcriptional MerR regulator
MPGFYAQCYIMRKQFLFLFGSMAKLKQISFDFNFNDPERPVEENLAILTVEEPAETAFQETTQKPIIKKTGIRGRKSIKDMEREANLIKVPEDEILFSKQYYSMQEVTAMFLVNHSLIRFWEAEFDILQPRKNKKGDRLFRPEDVKNLAIIYYLLRQKKFTMEGAKDYIKKKKNLHQRFEAIQKLEQLKAFLLELKAGIG